MPSLALSAQIRLCRLGKVLARYSEGNLSSSVIRLGKCQGADAQEQHCCSSQIPNHWPQVLPPPPPKHTPYPFYCIYLHDLSTPFALAAIHSKTIGALSTLPSQSCDQAALAAYRAADLLPASNTVNYFTSL